MKEKLPSEYDPFKLTREAISSHRFEDKYNKLLSLYSASTAEIDKPKSEQKFPRELRKFIHDLFLEYYDTIEHTRERISKKNITRSCSSCGTVFPPDPMDYFNSTHGEKVKFLCHPCKLAKKS